MNMKKFLKENSYYIFLVFMMQTFSDLSIFNWEWWVTMFGVIWLVTWKADKEE